MHAKPISINITWGRVVLKITLSSRSTRIPRDVTQAHKLRGGNDWLTRDFCVKGSLLCTATGCRLTHQQACPLLDAESSAHTGAHPFASCPNRFGAQRLASRKTT